MTWTTKNAVRAQPNVMHSEAQSAAVILAHNDVETWNMPSSSMVARRVGRRTQPWSPSRTEVAVAWRFTFLFGM